MLERSTLVQDHLARLEIDFYAVRFVQLDLERPALVYLLLHLDDCRGHVSILPIDMVNQNLVCLVGRVGW